jgi:hypothetical protein
MQRNLIVYYLQQCRNHQVSLTDPVVKIIRNTRIDNLLGVITGSVANKCDYQNTEKKMQTTNY